MASRGCDLTRVGKDRLVHDEWKAWEHRDSSENAALMMLIHIGAGVRHAGQVS